MKRLLALALITACSPFVTASSVAQSGTIAYTTGGLFGGTLDQCLKAAKATADKVGFTEEQVTLLDDDKKAGDFHASKKDSSNSMSMRCSPKKGIWTLGFSGINREETYQDFSNYVDALH